MAFFSNSGSRADSGGYNLNEKADDEGAYESVRDRDADLNSGQLNLNEKADDAYHSEEEQYEAGQSGLNPSEIKSGQNAPRVGGPSGPWGTNFLKDCRSTEGEEPSNSDRGMEDGSAASSHDDMDGSGEDDELNRGHGDVPAEEMLSDDYYEQDREEQSDSLSRRGMSHPSCSTSGAASKSVPSRQKKSTKGSAYDDDDDAYNDENDNDDDDDDDADEDDPDDVDFEPDSETDKAAVKEKLVDSENSGEEEEDDELELSDDDDDFIDSRRQSKRLKVGGTKTSQRKKLPMQAPRKRGVSFTDEEYSSGKDSDAPNSPDFSHRPKKPVRLHLKTVGHNDVFSNVNSHNESRTSGRRRTQRNISYAESDSDDSEEKSTKQQKLLKEDQDEEDGETIERVIWYQPKGVAEDALRNGQSTQPTVMSMPSDFDQQWDDVEFYIKWKGQSYLHCQWKTLSELRSVSGFKKVLNYMKRVSEEQRYKRSLSREEVTKNFWLVHFCVLTL
ncbi:unnamed protein product [Triticum turgidum subsp. durum]|uniref:Chromo domain-containing protein n=1 Tax=Triticum turgidum subsp. durum TaxID=4567 RepID=A0A9R1PG38_TRITD|nr:unnamed protein product [Triticum turgidum subsp. durum]